MFGPDMTDMETQGMVPRILRSLFCMIENADVDEEFTIAVSMCEIYNEKINDLLDTSKVNL